MIGFRETLDEIQVLIERGECEVSDLKYLWNTLSDTITEYENIIKKMEEEVKSCMEYKGKKPDLLAQFHVSKGKLLEKYIK